MRMKARLRRILFPRPNSAINEEYVGAGGITRANKIRDQEHE
jgi:hypothetical protein